MANMSENAEMMEALRNIAAEKDIPYETLLDALANALATAYKRRPNAADEARVTIDAESGEYHVYAQEFDDAGNLIREWEDTPEDFGRIAAQTAKQVILQRIREEERELKFQEFEGREGDLVTGIVQQGDSRFLIVDIGKAEALLPKSEQVPHERYEPGSRIRAYISKVTRSAKGPQVIISRTHPNLVSELFRLEVPEIFEKIVEIKAIAREAGHRTKIAVMSNDPAVDPVGACVGARGARVRMVVNELRGEKVDIVQWTPDIHQFVANALSPAKVKEVKIDPDEKSAQVVVPDFQLSLAIGKEGQNARLAAKLTGLRIDIRSESQVAADSATSTSDGHGGDPAGDDTQDSGAELSTALATDSVTGASLTENTMDSSESAPVDGAESEVKEVMAEGDMS